MLFPLYDWTKIEAKQVQAALQTAFEHWGLPDSIRFDNGRPWGNPVHRVPTALALWLVGLGVTPIFGRPRQSTDNAVVERSHGVLQDWVEPATCPDYTTLQQRLHYFVTVQREEYPACDGITRLQAFSTLAQARRPYRRTQDEQLWDVERVQQYVSQYRWTRTPDQNGRVSILMRDYTIGKAWAGQKVTCWLEPESVEWVIEDQRGEIIKRLPAKSLDYPTIASLSLKYRHKGQTSMSPEGIHSDVV